MHVQRVTYILLVIVIGAAAVAFTSRGNERQAKQTKNKFPVANYDEPEPTDPVEKAARKEKQKRYDGPSIVARKPHPSDVEVNSIYEGPQLPALPTSKSNVIVLGTVQSGEAHLSENKKNVYSEFTVQLDNVLKADVSLPTNNIITVDREGGIVAYPNGQQILYRTSRENMPSIGRRYVFFLQYVNQDFRILTAYELRRDRVVPLDDLDQFQKFAGQDATTFLSDIRNMLSTPGTLSWAR